MNYTLASEVQAHAGTGTKPSGFTTRGDTLEIGRAGRGRTAAYPLYHCGDADYLDASTCGRRPSRLRGHRGNMCTDYTWQQDWIKVREVRDMTTVVSGGLAGPLHEWRHSQSLATNRTRKGGASGVPVPTPRRAARFTLAPRSRGHGLPLLAHRLVGVVVLESRSAPLRRRSSTCGSSTTTRRSCTTPCSGGSPFVRSCSPSPSRDRCVPRVPARVLRGSDGERPRAQRPVVRRRDAAVGELPREGFRLEDDAAGGRSVELFGGLFGSGPPHRPSIIAVGDVDHVRTCGCRT